MADQCPTVQQCIDLSGETEYRLRNYCCAWCDQALLNALRYGCGAIWEKCDPFEKFGYGKTS